MNLINYYKSKVNIVGKQLNYVARNNLSIFFKQLKSTKMNLTRKFAARRTPRSCCLLRGILFIKRRFIGLRVRDSFSKTAEETSKTGLRPWYQDRWLQFCRNNTIFGLLKYREVLVK
jgi:hypothetical protein